MPHLAIFLVQLGVILAAARCVGWILRRFHQPQVVGEMVAGILLGPSLLGFLAPGLSDSLFPPESLGFLSAVSQLGVIVFMFLMGLEVDPGLLRSRGRTVLATSQAGILVPFALGCLLGFFLYPRLSPPGVVQAHFVMFMGTAMSITAFPVLARILSERRLMGTEVGTIALACAAAGDLVGWCLLAFVVLIVRSQGFGPGAVWIPLWILLLAATLWFVVRTLLGRVVDLYHRRGFLTNDLLALVLLLVLASAWASESAGVHALFGAFAVGLLMPRRTDFAHALKGKLQDLTVVLLLPVFFALTGLNTRIGLLNSAAMWGYLALVLLVAIAGKLGGSTFAARMSGLGWRQAAALGVLMNTRGLVELILLNIGLEIGVISPAVFGIMVIMALVTTFMTSPLIEWIYPAERAEGATRLVA